MLQAQQKSGAAFCAGMLGEEQDAGLGALGCGAIAKPCRQGDTRCKLGRDTAHVEHDGSEAASLQQQVGDAQRLVYV